MSRINSVDIKSVDRPELPMGINAKKKFSKLMKRPLATEPDVDVAGDWVTRAMATQEALLEYTKGLTKSERNYSNPEVKSRIMSTSSPGGLDADFGSGDASVTVGVGSGYYIDNPGYANSTTLYYEGNRALSASEGEKAVDFNPPNGEVAFLIGQRSYGYQFGAVAALLKSLPQMGSSNAWQVPSFGTVNGPKSLSAVYTYSTPMPARLPFARTSATVKVPEDTQGVMRVRRSNGSVVIEQKLDLKKGSNNVVVAVGGIPSVGRIEYHVPGTNFTVSDTQMRPPLF